VGLFFLKKIKVFGLVVSLGQAWVVSLIIGISLGHLLLVSFCCLFYFILQKVWVVVQGRLITIDRSIKKIPMGLETLRNGGQRGIHFTQRTTNPRTLEYSLLTKKRL
jgi:hypothetical protein